MRNSATVDLKPHTPAATWTFGRTFDLFARASLFISAGLFVKTLLVGATQNPDPHIHLGYWIPGRTPIRAALLALTNPFLWAAILFTVRGLRLGGVPGDRAALAGSAPWVLTMILMAISGIARNRSRRSFHDRELERAPRRIDHAASSPGDRSAVSQSFPRARCVCGPSGAQDRRRAARDHDQRISDHASLERAIGEALPIEVTGSIRGASLLDLELPGRNPAVPESRAFADAARYVAILELAPVAANAPRWFIEGLAHAEAIAYSPTIDLAYVSGAPPASRIAWHVGRSCDLPHS